MGRKCCVPGCTSGKNVPSHRFPKNPERCSKWIESLKLDHFKNYTSHQMQDNKVCYKHFHSKDYSPCLHKRVLLNIAVPVPLVSICDHMDHTVSNDTQNVPQHQQQLKIYVPENKEQHNQNIQCENNEDMISAEENNKQNVAIEQHEKLMDCNVDQKVNENLVLKQQDKIDFVIENYGHRLQTLETQMKIVTNVMKKRPQFQEITRSRNLSPMSRRLYEMNIKLKCRNRYLKHLIYKNKQQKRKRTVPIESSTASIANSTAVVREN